LSLLKILDAALDSSVDNLSSEYVAAFTDTIIFDFRLASAQAMPFIRAAGTSPHYSNPLLLQLTAIWNTLVIVLDMFQCLLDHHLQTAVSVMLNNELIPELVTLLGESHKNLPKRSKLKDIEHKKDIHEVDPQEFPYIKGQIIYVISLLAQENKSVQDTVRELHGLEVILSNCVIDLNNPCKQTFFVCNGVVFTNTDIRERSIMCIRYLLNGNPENQNFVAGLEAKQAVTEDALEEAGYEAEVVNGKVKLKKKED
jgi:ataxin-10